MRINGKPDGGGGGGVIASLSVTSNGTYTAGQGVDGYSPVTVDVDPDLQDKTINENGEYTADQGYDGLGTVTVSVQPSLQDKNVTENGEYTADEGYYGLSTVTVSVPGPVTSVLSVSDNGTYTPGTGVDGFSQVVVDVPQTVTGFTEKEITEETYAIYNLSNSASFVHRNVFEDDDNLLTVYLPNASYVGSEAFRYCDGLTRVELPECKRIYQQAFNACSSLSYVSIPKCTDIIDGAFSSCINLKEVYCGDIELIRIGAFSACNKLTSVYNTSKLQSVASHVFYYCYSLSNIDLQNVETINDQGFRSCSQLTSVSLLNCKFIGQSAFYGCGFSEVYLPNINSIAYNAFTNCSSLEVLSLPSDYYKVFDYAQMLTGTKIANGTGSIYVPSALYDQYIVKNGWSSLAARFVSVPSPSILLSYSNGLVYGDTAKLEQNFHNYLGVSQSSVTDVDLPEVITLYSYNNIFPFSGYYNLKTAKLGKLSYISDKIFQGLSRLTTVDLPSCKYVDSTAFMSCYSLKTINLPECSYIGDAGFMRCSSLESIDLTKCEYIGYNAFSSCAALQLIDLPVCSYIGSGAFTYCTGLSTLILRSNSVCVLGDNSVFSNVQLSNIYVTSSLVEDYKTAQYWSRYSNIINPIMSDFEFSDGLVYGWATSMNSDYLTTLGITAADVTGVSMSRLTEIGSSTFMNHTNLTSISIPLVTEYKDDAFNGCTSLSYFKIDYADGVITAGSGIFDNCPALTSIEVPFGLLSSYQTAPGWSEYSSLMFEVIPELSYNNGLVYGSTTSIDSTFTTTLGITKNQVISVNLPNVQTTGTNTFYSCQQLTTVSMNECTSLNSSCFAECIRLQTLSLPKCEYIGDRCFQGAFQSNTTGVHISLDLPVCSYIGASAFYWTQRSLTLTLGYSGIVSIPNGTQFVNTTVESIYVPASLVEDYKVANYWSNYANKIFPIPE